MTTPALAPHPEPKSPDPVPALESLATELRRRLSGESTIACREPLATRTTLRVGGPADLYVEPAGEADLAATVEFCSTFGLPRLLLGRGSNLLIRDGGVRGVVIRLNHPAFADLTVEGTRLSAGAGTRLRDLANEARRQGLSGLEFLEGIPGSVGGALRMNAGAMQSWTFSVIDQVRLMDPTGRVHQRPLAAIPCQYRSCPLFKDHIALGAVFVGRPDAIESIRERMESYSRRRWKSQPPQPSAGCLFKNPDSIPAGRLIDELGLKGTRVGGAMVSEVHGNFIVNTGGASARDVLELMEQVRSRVRESRGLELETEVEVVGADLEDCEESSGTPGGRRVTAT